MVMLKGVDVGILAYVAILLSSVSAAKECSGIICDDNAECITLSGLPPSCRCITMFQGNGTFCEAATCDNGNRCGSNAKCSIEHESFKCTCVTGYTGDGNGLNCIDVDECATSTHNCDVNADCKNTVGSYECECKSMYFGNGTFCQEKTCESSNPCGANTVCSKTPDAFHCNCDRGYTGAIACVDIDECSLGTNDCDVNADCKNTAGSYTCSCKSTYIGNGTYCEEKTCENSNPCSEHATCNATASDFECKCVEGYTGEADCSDIDECASTVNNNCHSYATCENTLGSYSCQCKENYTGNGIKCEDLDECASSSTNYCDANAICKNTLGSYTCECKPMFFGNGTYCEEKTCENFNPCGENTECQATKTEFECTCLNGYTGAIACADIDECASANSNNCDVNAQCQNTDGSYTCSCKTSYTGNGTFCTRFCDATAVEIGNFTFTFDGSFEGGVSFSKEKCNSTGRSRASVTCTALPTGGFSFDKKLSVDCNETVSSVAKQINWNGSTSDELEKGMSRLAITVSSGNNLAEADRSTFIKSAASGAASLQKNESYVISVQTLRQIVVAADLIAKSFANTAAKGFFNTDNVTVARQAMTLRHSIEVFSAKSSLEKPMVSVVTTNIRAQVQTNLSDNANEYAYSSPTMRMLVPREAVDQAKAKGTPAANRLVFLEYSGTTLFQSSGNFTRVITVELGIGSEIKDLSKDVLFYPRISERELDDQPIPGKAQTRRAKLLCSYYVPEKLSFSQSGCRLLQNANETTCACDHMTSFAVLMEYEVIDDDIALSITTTVGCIISSIALAIALLVHVTGRTKNEKRHISLSINAHVCASLLMVYLAFVAGISQTHVYEVCLFVTVLLHYLLLLTWSWTTVYSYAMFTSLARLAPEKLEKRFIMKAGVFAYGLPLVVVGTTLLVKYLTQEVVAENMHQIIDDESRKVLKGYVAPNMCWLAGDSLKFGFLLPAGIMLLGNYFVFSYLVYCFTRQRFKMQSVTSRKNATREIVASVSMATTLGLTWIFGYMMLISTDKIYRNIMAWLFTITTILQGLLLFSFTLMRRAALRQQIFSSVKTRFSTISNGLSVRMKAVKIVKRNSPRNFMKDEYDSANSLGSFDTNLDQPTATKRESGLFSISDSPSTLQ